MLARKSAFHAAVLPLILFAPVAITFILIKTSVAAVTLESQLRLVQTFATVDFIVGDDPHTSDLFQSSETGVFDQGADCQAGIPGDQATSAAHQLSYITPELLLAEGSIQAQAEIGDLALFAEAFGESRFTSIFSVDEETEVALLATLIASGNGRGNLILRHVDGEILVYRSLQNGEDSVDERHTLPPGAYEMSAQVSGFGQAFPGGALQRSRASAFPSIFQPLPTWRPENRVRTPLPSPWSRRIPFVAEPASWHRHATSEARVPRSS